MKLYILLFSIFIISCKKKERLEEEVLSQKVKVLNMGTFHMGYTTDRYKSDFYVKSNKNQIQKLTQLISKFKPTIILVEIEPQHNELLEENYKKYIKNPFSDTEFQNEIQFIAFEVGRLSNTSKIYGIDHQLGYDYMGIDKLAKEINSKTYLNEHQKIVDFFKSGYSKNLIEQIIKMNEQEYYNALININADLLTYVNTKNDFEGADVAANFYKRNLRMFANINKIKVSDNDRIFILSGGTHAAFFDMLMKRSPRYKLVPLKEYLN